MGAETPKQVRENLDLMGEEPMAPGVLRTLKEAMEPVLNAGVLDPSRWVY
jgi:hypothetical protein